ncbi:methyltransferase domain-containing protein [Hazenella sp. IB182357]|uniref:Protein-L-isoaspartate O-methyltransferase n=1 Tax=Polycladospora coralii TaxID=2771432 RepID=A0A926RVU5_9BACL|nr:methyltransferase domain-containing protein [Polycladospora coralii]MBS7529536.1 methyltransferase domain-containing protein [Polycladospora coralii]
MENLDWAFQNTNRDDFVLQENGKRITQSTANSGIRNGLSMLDAREGNRVLEIGTGSGFSGALLSYLVGSSGSVISLDIEPTLTKRANRLYKEKDIHSVQCITRDGRLGDSDHAPFDRIIAWTTPQEIPNHWIEQLKKDGIIVFPFQVVPIARGIVTVSFKKVNNGLIGQSVSDEGYIPMSSEPVTDFKALGIISYADLIGGDDTPVWASGDWMKHSDNQNWLRLYYGTKPESSSFKKTGSDILPYLLAKNSQGLTFGLKEDESGWIGYSSPDGFALLSYHYPEKWMISDQNHAQILNGWINQWVLVNEPSYKDLIPIITKDNIKVELKGGD